MVVPNRCGLGGLPPSGLGLSEQSGGACAPGAVNGLRIKAVRVATKIYQGNGTEGALAVFVSVESPVVARVLDFADLDHLGMGALKSEFHDDRLSFGREPELLEDEVDQLGRTIDEGLPLDAVRGIVEHPDPAVFIERQAHGGG